MPLRVRGQEVVRHVTTDSDGAFTLSRLAPGEYRLEIHVPNGRIHHAEAFTVPPVTGTPRPSTEPIRLNSGDHATRWCCD